MNELPLIVLGGLLGSSHCVGMCGPFALTIGMGAHRFHTALERQLAYSVGRIFTYACAGAAVGYGGLRFVRGSSSYESVQAILCIVAGGLLVLQGLWAANLVPRFRGLGGTNLPCAALRNFGGLLRSPSPWHVFLAGMFTGFLPCGLVYAYLALAASTADLFRGMATMAAFGAGTVPVMVLAGASGRLVSLAVRRRLFQVAAGCVILTGGLTIYRGATALSHAGAGGTPGCPFCIDAR